MGDGLLTTDDPYHKRSRQIMLPAFHRERIAASIDVMTSETARALEQLTPGARIDLYAWTRHLATRVAMRALFGLDPDGGAARSIDAAALFEQALAFYASSYQHRFLRGQRHAVGAPSGGLQKAQQTAVCRDRPATRQRRARRGRAEPAPRRARTSTASTLTDTQIRDEMMTLLFAGHDTTTSTVSFMFYELARHPWIADAIVVEQHAHAVGATPSAAQMMSGELSQLEMTLEETLRKYPPAWIGPRKSVEAFEFEGHKVPANAYVNYSSWASHHLPDVFADPERFSPERFAPDARASIPKGAYIPFGGGSRTCIGMRFGQLEVRTIATMILARFALELPSDFKMEIRQMPTISPKRGLPMIVRERSGERSVQTGPDRQPIGERLAAQHSHTD